MIVNPREVEQALIDQVRRLDVLVLDDDGVVVFGEAKRVNPARVLGSCRKLRRHEATLEDDIKVRFDELLKGLLGGELRLRYWLKGRLGYREQWHV